MLHSVRGYQQHILKNDRLNLNDFIEMNDRQKLKTILQPQGLINILDDLLQLIEEAIKTPCLDFHDPMLSNDDHLAWTGWNIVELDTMFKVLSLFFDHSAIEKHEMFCHFFG